MTDPWDPDIGDPSEWRRPRSSPKCVRCGRFTPSKGVEWVEDPTTTEVRAFAFCATCGMTTEVE